MFDCPNLAVPMEVMQHVVHVESSQNPYAIGVVGGRLAHQPRTLNEAIASARRLEAKGYNFSLGIAQVNRYNLAKYGLNSYEQAFNPCLNIQAGSRILRECYDRAKDWGKAFSCYYSGNFITGYKHGYVQKIFASMRRRNQQPQTQIARTAKSVFVTNTDNTALRRAEVQYVSNAKVSRVVTSYNNRMEDPPLANKVAFNQAQDSDGNDNQKPAVVNLSNAEKVKPVVQADSAFVF